MRKERVKALPYQAGSVRGIDLEICAADATVQDYVVAMDWYIMNAEMNRLRSETTRCEGCDICCRERMPLTSIDCLHIKRAVAPQLDWFGFFAKYTYVSLEKRAVDIVLSRDSQDACIFLDKEEKRCRHYEARPLVCRTYICTVFSPRAASLRQAIINTGEDELVRWWLNARQEGRLVVHEAQDPAIKAEDWPVNSWTGKTSFDQIQLQSIATANLWKKLWWKGEDLV